MEKPEAPRGKPVTLGRYTLVREIGRGGMGVVYEAVDAQLNRKVALKLLVPRPHADAVQAEAERQRFLREAQASAKLKHPNIVTLFEAGALQGKLFLAMELVAGQPFSRWWKQKGLTLHQKAAVLRDVALAVHHAHEQGILHRDLKPENVLIGPDHKPFVMDFGLAKLMGENTGLSLTGDGFAVGTPAYMSPEQARGLKTVDARTDVYSLGVILYEILTGRKPFEGETAIEILMKAQKDRVQPPSSARILAPDPALDKAIENIALKALEKNPKDRYPSTQAFAQDLTRWMEGDVVKVTLSSTRRRVVAAPKRSIGWIFAVAGVAFAGILAALLLWPSSPAPSAEAELARARQFMKEKRYTDARIEFGKALVKDPRNGQAVVGDRDARAAEELEKGERTRREEAEKAGLTRQLQEAKTKADDEVRRIREEADQKVKAAAAASQGDPARAGELRAIQERVRKAEEEARLARERLEKMEAERLAAAKAPPVAPTPAPTPIPPALKPPVSAPVRPPLSPFPKPLPPVKTREELAAARDAAVALLDLPSAFKAIDQMAGGGLEPDPIAAKAAALKAARKLVKTKEEAGLLAGGHVRHAEHALAADDFKTAAATAKEAGTIAKQAGDPGLIEQAASLQKELVDLKPSFDRHERARKTLDSNPQDPASNTDEGRWLCLVKDSWEKGLSLLSKGSDEPLRKLAELELANPQAPDAQGALAEAWFAAGGKEKNDALKARIYSRALTWYDAALPSLRGAERTRAEKRIDDCLRAGRMETRFAFVADKSMKLFPIGHRQTTFPEQKSDDATAVFRGEAIYFNQQTGTDVLYEVRSGRRFRQLSWKGAAVQQMTIEVLDLGGNVLGKGGPWGGGNQWAEFTVDFPPTPRFLIRLKNHISSWYLIDKLELR